MREFLSVLYFIGLVMCSAAVSSLYDVTAYGFVILGGGLILYAGVGGLLVYLRPQ